jgi:hypothetical protein
MKNKTTKELLIKLIELQGITQEIEKYCQCEEIEKHCQCEDIMSLVLEMIRAIEEKLKN